MQGDAKDWYVKTKKGTLGPIPWEELLEAMQRCELSGEEEIASRENPEWRKISSFPAMAKNSKNEAPLPSLPNLASVLRKKIRTRTAVAHASEDLALVSGKNSTPPPAPEQPRTNSKTEIKVKTSQDLETIRLLWQEVKLEKKGESRETSNWLDTAPPVNKASNKKYLIICLIAVGALFFFLLGQWTSSPAKQEAEKTRGLKEVIPSDPSSPTMNTTDPGDPIQYPQQPTPPKRNESS